MLKKIKELYQQWKYFRRVKACYNCISKKMEQFKDPTTDTLMLKLSKKYGYMVIVEAMTLYSKHHKCTLLFPNHEIRAIYLSKFENYSAPTTTVELMGFLEDTMVLIPPMAREYLDEALFKVKIDLNNNKFLWTI